MPNFSIEEFKSVVAKQDGFAKTNLFTVLLPNLSGSSGPASTSYDLALLCTSITLPSRQLTTVARELGPTKRDVVYGYVNPNVNMTFRVLNDQKVRKYFEQWQRLCLYDYEEVEGRWEASYPDDYSFPITIQQLNKGVSYPLFNKQWDRNVGPFNVNLEFNLDTGTPMKSIYTWLLHHAYPVSVTHETLNDAAGEISTINVEFAYEFWKGEKTPKDKSDKFMEAASKFLGILGGHAPSLKKLF